jgi:hypothetical protein
MEGHITPTYIEILGDWHVECFKEFSLQPQALPYECPKCGEAIQHKEQVYYATIGSKPLPGYVRPESRGYEMKAVFHVCCAAKK